MAAAIVTPLTEEAPDNSNLLTCGRCHMEVPRMNAGQKYCHYCSRVAMRFTFTQAKEPEQRPASVKLRKLDPRWDRSLGYRFYYSKFCTSKADQQAFLELDWMIYMQELKEGKSFEKPYGWDKKIAIKLRNERMRLIRQAADERRHEADEPMPSRFLERPEWAGKYA